MGPKEERKDGSERGRQIRQRSEGDSAVRLREISRYVPTAFCLVNNLVQFAEVRIGSERERGRSLNANEIAAPDGLGLTL